MGYSGATTFGQAFDSVCSVDKTPKQYLVYTKAKQKAIMIESGDWDESYSQLSSWLKHM